MGREELLARVIWGRLVLPPEVLTYREDWHQGYIGKACHQGRYREDLSTWSITK